MQGNYRIKWARIGNSVPPLMMKAIAKHLECTRRRYLWKAQVASGCFGIQSSRNRFLNKKLATADRQISRGNAGKQLRLLFPCRRCKLLFLIDSRRGTGEQPASGIPRSVWVLGFVSMFMDISSELIHSLLPVFMVSSLAASALDIGLVEGVAEATA
jgi:hypothetical protein